MRSEYIAQVVILCIVKSIYAELDIQCSINQDGSQKCTSEEIQINVDRSSIGNGNNIDFDNAHAEGDKSEHCQFWASKGECDANPDYMLPNCPISCKIHEQFEQEEIDFDEDCPMLAQLGECYVNPKIKNSCTKSCFEYDLEMLKKTSIFTQAQKRLINQRSDRCQLYMAESSIPNAGLGMFTAVDIYQGELVFYPEIIVNFFDNRKHAERNMIYKEQRKDQKLWKTIVGDKVDEDPNCHNWALSNECEKNPLYMLESCMKSCALYQSGMIKMLDPEINWLPMSYYWNAGK